jgi:hypothetical protein
MGVEQPAAAEAPVAAHGVSDAAYEASEEAAKQQLIDAIDAEFDEGETEKPSPTSKAAKKAPSKVASKDETEEEASDEEADDSVDEEDAQASFEDAAALKGHIKTLIESGDLRKLETELGLEKGALKINGSKLRYVREQSQKAAAALQTAERKAADAQSLVQQAQQVYGPMVRAKQLFQSGSADGVQQAARFVEAHFGVPIAQFVDAVVKAGRGQALPRSGPDPEVAELKLTVQRLLEQQTRAQADAQLAQAKARHVAGIKAKLGSSPLGALPDGAQRVYDRLVASYDRGTGGYSLSLQDAIKAVADDPATKWLLHERAQKAKPKDDATESRGSKPKANGTPAAPVKALTYEEREEQEKRALIAELEAEALKAERAARAARRSHARK